VKAGFVVGGGVAASEDGVIRPFAEESRTLVAWRYRFIPRCCCRKVEPGG